MKRLLLILLCVPLMFSCGEKNEEKKDNTENTEKDDKINKLEERINELEKKGINPTKELMITTLYKLHNELKNNNYGNAVEYFILPTGISEEKLMSEMSRLIEIREISKEGIKILESDAIFGKVIDIYGEKGRKAIDRKGLIANQCFGLNIEHSSIEVMALWKDNKFLFFRMDNVGKLE